MGIGTACEKNVVEGSTVATGTLTQGRKRRKPKDSAAVRYAVQHVISEIGKDERKTSGEPTRRTSSVIGPRAKVSPCAGLFSKNTPRESFEFAEIEHVLGRRKFVASISDPSVVETHGFENRSRVEETDGGDLRADLCQGSRSMQSVEECAAAGKLGWLVGRLRRAKGLGRAKCLFLRAGG